MFFSANAAGCDLKEIKQRAIAELVEHSVAVISGVQCHALCRSSYRSFPTQLNEIALNPSSLVQSQSGIQFGLDSVDSDSILSWVRGYDIQGNYGVYLPALVGFLSWMPPVGEPLFVKPGATGLSAHISLSLAIEHALFEVIERDACMLCWRVPGWPTSILSHNCLPVAYKTMLSDMNLCVHLFQVGDPSLVPVVVAIIVDLKSGSPTVGSAAGWCVDRLCEKATIEAFVVRYTVEKFCRHSDEQVPRSSFGHVCSAFKRGGHVLNWFLCQSNLSRNHVSWTKESVFQKVFDFCAESAYVEISDERCREMGWFVVRVIVPRLQQRESDSLLMNLSSSRLDESIRRYAHGRPPHLSPHPFG